MKLTDSEEIDELSENLGAEDSDLRREARWELLEMGEDVVKPLITQLDSEDATVVKNAAWVLGRVEDPRAVDGLVDLLGDESTSVRKRAARALVKIGEEALPAMLAQLGSEDVVRRRIAAWFLPDFEDPGIGEALFEALGDGDPLVRRNAARAVGVLDVEGAVDVLRDALGDSDWRVRQWAAFSLGLISRRTGATRALIKALNDPSPHVEYAAIVALGDNGSKSAVGRLMTRLGSDDPVIRSGAVKALGNIGSRKAVPRLLELYGEGGVLRGEVLLALARIGGVSEIYGVLEDGLGSGDEDLRDVAETALNLMGTGRAQEILKKYGLE